MKLLKILVPDDAAVETINAVLVTAEEELEIDFGFTVRVVEGEATTEDLYE